MFKLTRIECLFNHFYKLFSFYTCDNKKLNISNMWCCLSLENLHFLLQFSYILIWTNKNTKEKTGNPIAITYTPHSCCNIFFLYMHFTIYTHMDKTELLICCSPKVAATKLLSYLKKEQTQSFQPVLDVPWELLIIMNT